MSLRRKAKPLSLNDGKVPWLTCAHCGKRTYGSKVLAKKAMKAIRSTPGHQPANIYECKSGSGWHVTSIPRREWNG